MTNIDDYQMKYWPTENSYLQNAPGKRSIKRKLTIVASFLFVLALTPSLIFALPNLGFDNAKEVTSANTNTNVKPVPVQPMVKKPEVHKVTIELPKKAPNQIAVISNDSYWKISKRACGTGQFYLSIKDQNGGKALYLGDIIIANCTL